MLSCVSTHLRRRHDFDSTTNSRSHNYGILAKPKPLHTRFPAQFSPTDTYNSPVTGQGDHFGSEGHRTHKAGRCVMWSPIGTPDDPHLTHALQRPNIDVRKAHDDLAAIAGLLDGLSTRDLAKPEPRILLCIEPHKLVGLAECLEVLSTYVHELTLWVFDPSRSDVLRKVSQQELLSYRAQVATQPATQPAPQPALRPKIDVHQSESHRTMDVTTGPTLSTAQGQTAWVGPWGTAPATPQKASESQPESHPAAQPDHTTRTEQWSLGHNLRLTGGVEDTQPAPQEIASQPPPLPQPAIQPVIQTTTQPAAPIAQAPTPVPTNLQPSESASQEPLLTDEELAMLLGDDPRFSGQS